MLANPPLGATDEDLVKEDVLLANKAKAIRPSNLNAKTKKPCHVDPRGRGYRVEDLVHSRRHLEWFKLKYPFALLPSLSFENERVKSDFEKALGNVVGGGEGNKRKKGNPPRPQVAVKAEKDAIDELMKRGEVGVPSYIFPKYNLEKLR